MLANKILKVLTGIFDFVVIPVQFMTTFLLGILVSLSFGLLLLPITLIWIVFSFPMIGASWLAAKIEWLRTPIGLVGIPWAIFAQIFVALMPSMGELESRAAKLMLCLSWPYSWEFWMFQNGKLNLASPECASICEVIDRISHGSILMQQTVNRIAAGEALDQK